MLTANPIATIGSSSRSRYRCNACFYSQGRWRSTGRGTDDSCPCRSVSCQCGRGRDSRLHPAAACCRDGSWCHSAAARASAPDLSSWFKSPLSCMNRANHLARRCGSQCETLSKLAQRHKHGREVALIAFRFATSEERLSGYGARRLLLIGFGWTIWLRGSDAIKPLRRMVRGRPP